jgi:hypothetical protein
MRIVRLLGWNLILLLIATAAYAALDISKPTIAGFCKPTSQFSGQKNEASSYNGYTVYNLLLTP